MFGSDNTGDILNPENRLSILERINVDLPDKVDLVTADGSIDCQGDPANQEAIVTRLHLAEVAVALNCLNKGGHLVLKMFTLFESSSICLMYLLVCSFNSVSVFKPATSKEGNSEIYVVCRHFKDDLSAAAKAKILDVDDHIVLFKKEDVPEEFIRKIVECATKMKEIQCGVIKKNIETFKVCNQLCSFALNSLKA